MLRIHPGSGAVSHTPVLLREAIDALAVREGGIYCDATFGGGGYSAEIIARGGVVYAIDRDPDAVARAAAFEASHENRFTIIASAFGDLDRIASEPFDGVVFDLGVSSFQLDEGARGFSFQADADLDMRMEKSGPSAADAVNGLSEAALKELIRNLGEDDDARRIARGIVRAREAEKITRTGTLAEIIEEAVGGRKGARTHPATKTFQALRMLVNDELGELARGLSAAERALAPGGRLSVVTFHSLEDRMVKNFITERADARGRGSRHAPETTPAHAPSFALDHKKAIKPSDEETQANPRARSAKLRWATRTEAAAWPAFEPRALAPLAQSEWESLS